MSEHYHIYHQRAQTFRAREQALAQRLSYTSIVRLVSFVAFAAFVYLSFKNRFDTSSLLIALLFFIVFLVFVMMAASIKRNIKYVQQLVRINDNETGVADGKPSQLHDGAGFAIHKGFTADLNIFGKHSLYHLLNRTGSHSGNKQLAHHLAHPFTDSAAIENYQHCVKELSEQIEFRQTLLAQTLLLREEDTADALQKAIRTEDFSQLKKASWSLLAAAWPLLGIGSIAYGIYSGNYRLAIAVTFIGLVMIGAILKKINLLYYHISRRSYLYAQYAKCFRLISEQEFKHPYLQQKKEEIIHASKAFQRLSRLTGLFDLRLSMFTLFINGLFLFDLLCARAYLNWNERYQPGIRKWFETLGEIEMLNSVATYHYNHPSFVFPRTTDTLAITATAMGHPLMKEYSAVVNNLSIGEQSKLLLITGSNMSGKSTFLRTLGLNITLAQLGAPVFASEFVFRPVRLLTSFHHIDSLEESTSYFYAELKSLQDIIHSLSNPVPALVLLDEVMRGTNSKDKHDGSALLIKKLLNYPCLTLIATHDIELGVLAEQYKNQIENFSFESVIDNDELHFDFKMRPGIAQAKNATFLMRKMGIIE